MMSYSKSSLYQTSSLGFKALVYFLQAYLNKLWDFNADRSFFNISKILNSHSPSWYWLNNSLSQWSWNASPLHGLLPPANPGTCHSNSNGTWTLWTSSKASIPVSDSSLHEISDLPQYLMALRTSVHLGPSSAIDPRVKGQTNRWFCGSL
jgi:hypothetical protein